MSKVTGKLFSLCVGAILILLLSNISFGQIDKNEILNQELDLKFSKGNIFQISASLATFEKIPIGFEMSSDIDFDSNEIVQIKNGTLKEILDSIIKQKPNYKWEIRGGVVNLYPIQSRDEIIKTLLETKFENFTSSKESGRQGIVSVILNSNRVKEFLDSKQIKLGTFTSANLYIKDNTTDLNISNTDLRDILNKVVYVSGDSKLWTIKRTDSNKIILSF